MTAATISRAANDQQLKDRVLALANKEVLYNEEMANSEFGKRLRTGSPDVGPFMFPIAVDTEAAYESALTMGRGAPGHDMDVITDAALTSAIVAHWPWTDAERPQTDPDFVPIPPHGPDDVPVIDNTLPET